MSVQTQDVPARGIRITVKSDGVEMAHAYVYIFHNDLHAEPLALLENVWVEPKFRQGGVGTQLLTEVRAVAERAGCYKIVLGVEEPWIKRWYARHGYSAHGTTMRMDLK